MPSKPAAGTILLVDDEPLVRRNAAAILASGNYAVIEAANGLEAVAAFEARRDSISLVVMDISMPRMGGIAASRKMRELDPAVKIVFISGSFLELPAGAQADGFLTKPLRGKGLLVVIQRLLAKA
jgi:two-component system cell cycle sensor histidine kinase/response regulator CckA